MTPWELKERLDRWQQFKASNLMAHWDKSVTHYGIFSYGEHWPLAVWNLNQGWVTNATKYHKPTTVKHQNLVNRAITSTLAVPVEKLIAIWEGRSRGDEQLDLFPVST